MISQEALNQAKQAYDIEAACITEMKNYLDEEQFIKALEESESEVKLLLVGTVDNAGSAISTCLIPNGNIFIAHSYGSSYYLYGIVCSINGTTITKGNDMAIENSTSYSGGSDIIQRILSCA